MAFGIREIARLAGVSPATVSRILNDPAYRCSSEERRARVLEIARANNYQPNEDAKRLRSGGSFSAPQKKICCFLARTLTSAPNGDQFFSSLARAVEQEAVMQGCALGFSYNASQTEELLALEPGGEEVGLVVLGRPEDPHIIPELQGRFPHIVFTGLQRFDDPVDQVVADGRDAARTALDYLFSLGHRQIGYIGETVRELRYHGYLDFLRAKGLGYDQKFVADCICHGYDGGYQAALRLMSHAEKPTAIFCANDLTAFGVINALHSLGCRVPDEVSVISVDNVELAQFTTPMLTTIQIPRKEISHFAVKLLLDKMEGVVAGRLTISLPCHLVVRNSCKKL